MSNEKIIHHRWKEGEFKVQSPHRYWVREDVCILCGCKRNVMKKNKKSTDHFVATFERSRMIFNHNNMPECWGAKNPQ